MASKKKEVKEDPEAAAKRAERERYDACRMFHL